MKPRKPTTGTRLSLEHRAELEAMIKADHSAPLRLDLSAPLVRRALRGEELSAVGHTKVITALDRVRAENQTEVRE